MEDRIEISSDDEFDLDKGYDIPLGQRLAIKRTAETSVDREPPLKKSLSCAFTDDEDADVSTPAPKVQSTNAAVEVIVANITRLMRYGNHFQSSGDSSASPDPLHCSGQVELAAL